MDEIVLTIFVLMGMVVIRPVLNNGELLGLIAIVLILLLLIGAIVLICKKRIQKDYQKVFNEWIKCNYKGGVVPRDQTNLSLGKRKRYLKLSKVSMENELENLREFLLEKYPNHNPVVMECLILEEKIFVE